MPKKPSTQSTPACDCCQPITGITRRRFLQSTAAAAALLPFGSVVEAADHAKKSAGKTSETLVSEFYKTLNEPQRQNICFPFNHELQSKIDNNWFITKTRVKEFTKDQQQMIREIVHNLHSEEYAKPVMRSEERRVGKECRSR